MAVSLVAIGLVVIGSLIGAFGAVYLKKGAKKFSLNLFKLMKNYYVLGGVFLYAVSTVFYMLGLRMEELSVLYPIVSMTYIFVSMLSVRMLNEKMNRWRWLGIVSIIIGVSLIGFGG
jgi:drug/metabolite transporter (DMT)-like permease